MRNSSSGKEAFCFLQAEDSKERVRHDVLLYLKLTIYKKICSPSLFSLLHFYVTKDIAVVGGQTLGNPWDLDVGRLLTRLALCLRFVLCREPLSEKLSLQHLKSQVNLS